MNYSDLCKLVGKSYCDGLQAGMYKSASPIGDALDLANYKKNALVDFLQNSKQINGIGELLSTAAKTFGDVNKTARGNILANILLGSAATLGIAGIGAGIGAINSWRTGDSIAHGAEVGGRIGAMKGFGGFLGQTLGGIVGREIGGSAGDGVGSLTGSLLGGSLGGYAGYKLPSFTKPKDKNS